MYLSKLQDKKVIFLACLLERKQRDKLETLPVSHQRTESKPMCSGDHMWTVVLLTPAVKLGKVKHAG